MHRDTEVVSAAEVLRGRAGLRNPPFSTSEILAANFANVVVIGHSLPVGVDEAVSRTPDGIVIVYRRGLLLGERRFAVAHAIGHLVFDDVRGSPMFRGRGGSPKAERRADRFAEELLVPMRELERHLLIGINPDATGDGREIYLDHVDQLASRFKAPSDVIDKRIRELILSLSTV